MASSCTFKDNYCQDIYGGGAVTLNGAHDFNEVLIEYSTFRNNTSKGGGGAVRAFGLGRMALYSSDFVASRAIGWGGAVYVDDLQLGPGPETGPVYPRLPGPRNLSVVIDQCRFVDNLLLGLKDPHSTYYGGGAVYTLANATITNSVFLSNRAIAATGREKDVLAGGGAIWNEGRLKGQNLQLLNNMAGKMGGGMALARGAAVLTQILFEGNTAGTQGGGLFVNGTLTPSSSGPSAASSTPQPCATGFLRNSAFNGNQVLGGSLYNDTGYTSSSFSSSSSAYFSSSFSPGTAAPGKIPTSPRYKVGGAALSVWGQLLVLDSSFEQNTIKERTPPWGVPSCGWRAKGSCALLSAHSMVALGKAWLRTISTSLLSMALLFVWGRRRHSSSSSSKWKAAPTHTRPVLVLAKGSAPWEVRDFCHGQVYLSTSSSLYPWACFCTLWLVFGPS